MATRKAKEWSESYRRLKDDVGDLLSFYKKVADNNKGEVFSNKGPLSVSRRDEVKGQEEPSTGDENQVRDFPGNKKLQQTCLRMCVIKCIVTWESFIRDMVEEAFRIAYANEMIEDTKRADILTKAITKYFGFSQKGDESQKVHDQLESLDRGNFTEELIKTHLSETVLDARFSPVLRELERVITKTFALDASVPLMSRGSHFTVMFQYLYKKKINATGEKLCLGFQAANDLIRLFYALRCCFAHGHIDIKVLKDFPPTIDKAAKAWNVTDEHFVSDFHILYQRVCQFEDGTCRDLHIGYRTACNIIYFIKGLAYAVQDCLGRLSWPETSVEAAQSL